MPWPLVGREPQLARIGRILERRGSVVLTGPAGVGKSRLAATAASLGGHAVLQVSATEAARSLPLGALATLLPTGQAGDNLLGWASNAVLEAAGRGPALLFVDDAHLLDPTSATLIHQVARRIPLLVTVRTGEPCSDSIMALWKEELAERIDLGPLPHEAIGPVLEAALDGPVEPATIGKLADLSRGNALYLRELVTAGLSSTALTQQNGTWRWRGELALPTRLTELIATRIGTLDEAQSQALELTAFAEPLELHALVQIAGEAAVETIEARGLIDIVTGGRRTTARLSHPLYGEAIRAGCPQLRARRRYRQLAETIEATPARRREDVLRLAMWRLESATVTDPAPLIAALRLAWAAHDYPLAERLGRAALDAGGGPETAVLLAPVLGFSGKPEEAEAVLAAVWERPCDERTRALLISTRINVLSALGRIPQAVRLLEEAERTLQEPENLQEMAFWRCSHHLVLGEFAEALRVADGIVTRPASDAMQAQGHMMRGWILAFTGRPLDAIAAVDQAMDLRPQWENTVPVMFRALYEIRRSCAVFVGDLDGFEQVIEEHAALVAEGRWELAGVELTLTRGVLERLRGLVARAVHRWETPEVTSAPPQYQPQAWVELAHAAALAGDAETASAAMSQAGDSFPLATVRFGVDLVRPWVAAARGELSKAVELAVSAADQMRDRGALSQETIARHDVVRLGAAHLVADRLAELAGCCQGEFVRLAAAHARARGDGAALLAVAENFEELGFLLHAAEAAAQASQAFEAAGRTASARAANARAWALAARCEGARTPALARLQAPGLTTRELEIAQLAAAGLTSKEIAARLVISVRTVDNHLQSAYTKLGVSSRAELGSVISF
ncbi:hypothetical protein ETD86_31685 [Nonomuraea turkmeniaca]|uniref:HTH luxR-type domain-containing protein n=1 Tax=Nonomuraea turkmeniaca TaxID=103838 RepID=A0A5S4FT75_9ACTN|nr:LuxR family transcriptional regulator [Nonomuraea turkmeniaca]TMR12902.1 hypothetical protein ETD86_31685 [Nonomuraea turkmeniaca]